MDVDLSSMDKDNINNFPGAGCWKKYLDGKTIKEPTSYGNKSESSLSFFSNDNSDLEGCLIVNANVDDSTNKKVKFELSLKDNNGRYILVFWGFNNIFTKESSGFVKAIKHENESYENVGLVKDKFSTTTSDGTELLAPPAALYKEKISWGIDKSSKGGWTWRRDCKNGQDRIGIFSSQFGKWSHKLFKKQDNNSSYWSSLFSGWEDKMGIWTKANQS